MSASYQIQSETLAQCAAFDVNLYSDLYKEAYGFRPRNPLGHLSAQQLDELWEELCEVHEESMAAEAAAEAQAMLALKGLVRDTIDLGAPDAATAVRWLMDDEEDIEYFLWEHGVTSFENINYVRNLLNPNRQPIN